MNAGTPVAGRIQTWTAILAAMVHGWRRGISRPLAGLVLFILVGLPLALLWFKGPSFGRKALTGEASLLLMVAWGALVYGLMVQNTATAARLVPGHAQRLRELMALGWCGVLGTLVGGGALLAADPTTVVWIFGQVMLAIALTVRWPLLAFLIWLWPEMTKEYFSGVPAALAELLGAGYGPAMLLAVLLIAWLLGGLIGAGGAGHLQRQTRLANWRRAVDTGMPSGDAGAVWNWLSRSMSAPYHRAVARLSRSPGSAVWPRVVLVFGPSVDWRVHACWAAVAAGVAVVGVAWLRWMGVPDTRSLHVGEVLGPAIGLTCMALAPVIGLFTACVRTRREQALVTLLPGLPRGTALNRRLVRYQLTYFAVAWALAATLETSLMAVIAPPFLPALVAGLVGLWPMAGLLFVDISRLPPQPNARLGIMLSGMFAGPGLAIAAHLGLGWPVAVVALTAGLLTAALLAWGWQRLGHLPTALPACRLA
jgi:hypothetical protein